MPTALSTGTVYRTWSYLRYVSHASVWSNMSYLVLLAVRVPRLCVVQHFLPYFVSTAHQWPLASYLIREERKRSG